MANLGPMAGQISHFVNYAPGGEDYSRQRYGNEYNRCIGVLERRRADVEGAGENPPVAVSGQDFVSLAGEILRHGILRND